MQYKKDFCEFEPWGQAMIYLPMIGNGSMRCWILKRGKKNADNE